MHSSSNSISNKSAVINPSTSKLATTTTGVGISSSISSKSNSHNKKRVASGVTTRHSSGVGKFELNQSGYGGIGNNSGGEKDYIYLNTKGICLLCYEECSPITIEEKRRVHLQTSINFCRLISRYLDFSLEEVIANPLKVVGKRLSRSLEEQFGIGEINNRKKYEKVAFELCDRCVNLAHAFNQVHFQVQFHQMILDRCVRSISEIIKNANKKSVNELFVLSEDDEAIRTQQKTFTRLTLGGLRSANRLRTNLYKKGQTKLSRSFPILKLKRISEDLISKRRIKLDNRIKGRAVSTINEKALYLESPRFLSSPELKSKEAVLASFLGCIVSFWIVISLSFINLDELVINIKKEKAIELKIERDIGMDVEFKYQVPNHLPPPPPVYHAPINGAATVEPKKKRTYKKKNSEDKGDGEQEPKKRKRTPKAKSDTMGFPTPTSSPSPSTPTSTQPFQPASAKKGGKQDKEKGEKKSSKGKGKAEKKDDNKKVKTKLPPVSTINSPNSAANFSQPYPPSSPQIQQNNHSPVPMGYPIQSHHSTMSPQPVGQQQHRQLNNAQMRSAPSPHHPHGPPSNQLQMTHTPPPHPSPHHQHHHHHQQQHPSTPQMHHQQHHQQYNYVQVSNQNQYVPAHPQQHQQQPHQSQPPPQQQQYYSSAPAPVPSSPLNSYQSTNQQQQQQHPYYSPATSLPNNTPSMSQPAPSNTINHQSIHQQPPPPQTQLPYGGAAANNNSYNNPGNINMAGTNYNYSYNVTTYNYSNIGGTVPSSSSTAPIASTASTWIPSFPSSGNDHNNSSTFSSLPPLQTSSYSFSSISGSGGATSNSGVDSSQTMPLTYPNYDGYGNITTPGQDGSVVNNVNNSVNSMPPANFGSNASNTPAQQQQGNNSNPNNTPINTAIYAYDGYGNYVLQHQETSYPQQYSSEPAAPTTNNNASNSTEGAGGPPAPSTSTSSSSYFSSLLPPLSDTGADSSSVLFNSAMDFDLDAAAFATALDEPAPSLTYEEPPPQFYDREVEAQQSEQASGTKTPTDSLEGGDGDGDGSGGDGSGGKLKSISVFPEVHWRQQQSNATSLKISCTHTGCTEQFITHAQLQLHLRAHGNFKCNFCHMYFGKAHNLALHEKTKHAKKGKCPRCDHHLTPSTFKYLLHFINDHLDISVHDKPCEICNKTFVFGTKAVNRKLHFKKYHDVQGKDPTTISTCKACNAQFIKESQLKDHQSHCSNAANTNNTSAAVPSGSAGSSNNIRTPSVSSTQSTSTTTTEEITFNTALATAEQIIS